MKYFSIVVVLLFVTNRNLQSQDQDDSWNLMECIDFALENNLDVKRQYLQMKNVQIDYNQSKSDLLPDINFGGNYGNRWGRSIDPTTNLFITERITSMGFSGNSSVTVFSGLQLLNSVKQNDLLLEAATFDMQETKNIVALNVANFYLNVILNQELVDIAENQLQATTLQLSQTEKLVQAGSLPISNLLDLKAQAATNETDLVNARNNLQLSLLNLKQAMQLKASADIEIEMPEFEAEDTLINLTVEEIFTIAEMSQPSIKSTEKYIAGAEIGIRVARGAYYPRLFLQGNMFSNYSGAADRPRQIPNGTENEIIREIGFITGNPSQTVSTIITQPGFTFDQNYTIPEQLQDNLSKSLALSLSIPVFNNFRARNNVQRAIIASENAQINAEEARNRLRQSIESAYNDFQASAQSYAAFQKQVQALEESYRSVERRYNLGAANFVDYQLAENNLFRARANAIRGKYQLIFNKKVLDFYMNRPLTF